MRRAVAQVAHESHLTVRALVGHTLKTDLVAFAAVRAQIFIHPKDIPLHRGHTDRRDRNRIAPDGPFRTVLTLVPANSPVTRTTGFSGAQESTRGGTYSHMYLNNKPLPPTYRSAHSMLSDSVVAEQPVRSTLSTFP